MSREGMRWANHVIKGRFNHSFTFKGAHHAQPE